MKIAVFYENILEGARASGMSAADALSSLRDEGMEMVYLSPESWKRDRDTLRPLLKKLGMGVEGMHGWCDFAGGCGVEAVREMVDLAAEAGAGNLLVIPGMLKTGNTLTAVEDMIAGMKEAVRYGREKGIPVLMEDFDGLLSPYNSIRGLKHFMDEVEGLGCAFDTGNFVIFHEDELAAFELFADAIKTVHLKDRAAERPHPGGYANVCADLRNAYSCAVGTGFIRIREILRRLKERGYGGNVIVELYGDDPEYMLNDIVTSIRWVKGEIG